MGTILHMCCKRPLPTCACTHAVPPASPAIEVTTPFNSVSWTLPEGSADERADSFTVTLNFTHNSTLAQQFTVGGGDRWAELGVVPGMNYTVVVTAHNQDGSTTSEPYQFTTPPGGMTNNSNCYVYMTVHIMYM